MVFRIRRQVGGGVVGGEVKTLSHRVNKSLHCADYVSMGGGGVGPSSQYERTYGCRV